MPKQAEMMTYVWAYLLSTVGGLIILAPLVRLMHRTSGTVGTKADQAGRHRPLFRWLDVWVGFTERAIATTLCIWAPKQLPLFIGGWVIAKLAAGWGRQSDPNYAPAHVIALVGNALSFAVAIAAGLIANPDFLAMLDAPE